MRIENSTKNTTLAENCTVADTFFTRLKGLLGTPSLNTGEGLLLVGEKSIHTFFMAFPIDVIYIDREKTVIKLNRNLVPNRIGKHISQSAYILEVPTGTIDRTRTATGDQLRFSVESDVTQPNI